MGTYKESEVWPNVNWREIDNDKYDPALQSWISSPRSLGNLCRSAGLRICEGVSKSCASLNQAREKLGDVLGQNIPLPEICLEEGWKILTGLGGDWPTSEPTTQLTTGPIQDDHSGLRTMVHRALTRGFGRGYSPSLRDQIDRLFSDSVQNIAADHLTGLEGIGRRKKYSSGIALCSCFSQERGGTKYGAMARGATPSANYPA